MTYLDDVVARVRPHVGRRIRYLAGPVTKAQFQRFAYAVDDTKAIHFDDHVARTAGFAGVVAPPLFLSSVFEWDAGGPEGDLRPDGTSGLELLHVPVGELRLMGAGQEVEFGAPVTEGVMIVVEAGIEDIQQKVGRSGDFLMITVLRRYHDGDGKCLAICHERFIAR